MKALLLMILLVPLSAAAQDKKAAEDPTLVVVKFSWKRDRRPPGGRPTQSAAGNYPVAGASTLGRMPSSRQPGAASIEEQAVTMREVESRDRRGGVYRMREFYKYKVTLRNTDARAVRAVYWSFETRQSSRPDDVARRGFFCSAKVRPGKERAFKVETPKAPSLTVGADTAASGGVSHDRVVINRVEYADDSFWQRPGWSHDPVTWRPSRECVELP